MSSYPASKLSPIRIWVFGLLLAIGWGLFAIFFTVASVLVVVSALGLIIATLLSTAYTARQTALRNDFDERLDAETRSLQNQLRQMLAAVPGDIGSAKQPAISTGASKFSPRTISEMSAACEVGRGLLNKLRAQRAQTVAVLGNLDSGVLLVNQNGRVTMANAAAKRFFSISWEPVGKPLVEAIRQPELLEAVRLVISDKAPRDVVADLRDDAGTRRVLRVLCSAVSFEDITAVLMTVRDESESHQVEEMRREFVANVSHELKTPLAAIKGYAETVELAIGDDPQAAMHFVSQIHDQCKRLERLIASICVWPPLTSTRSSPSRSRPMPRSRRRKRSTCCTNRRSVCPPWSTPIAKPP
jgi:PAS domain S-box-containing protein